MPSQVKRPKLKPLSPPSAFERKAHELVGRLIFTYSRLDLTLALFVAGHQGQEQREKVLQRLQSNESFKIKLDLVLPTVLLEYPEDAECMEIWEEWLRDANTLRLKRNDMIHGRWGFNDRLGEVTNIRGLPSMESSPETKYTLVQLEREVLRAQRIEQMLFELRFGNWRQARWKRFYGPVT
jgi:hypothetical protein